MSAARGIEWLSLIRKDLVTTFESIGVPLSSTIRTKRIALLIDTISEIIFLVLSPISDDPLFKQPPTCLHVDHLCF